VPRLNEYIGVLGDYAEKHLYFSGIIKVNLYIKLQRLLIQFMGPQKLYLISILQQFYLMLFFFILLLYFII